MTCLTTCLTTMFVNRTPGFYCYTFLRSVVRLSSDKFVHTAKTIRWIHICHVARSLHLWNLNNTYPWPVSLQRKGKFFGSYPSQNKQPL